MIFLSTQQVNRLGKIFL